MANRLIRPRKATWELIAELYEWRWDPDSFGGLIVRIVPAYSEVEGEFAFAVILHLKEDGRELVAGVLPTVPLAKLHAELSIPALEAELLRGHLSVISGGKTANNKRLKEVD